MLSFEGFAPGTNKTLPFFLQLDMLWGFDRVATVSSWHATSDFFIVFRY